MSFGKEATCLFKVKGGTPKVPVTAFNLGIMPLTSSITGTFYFAYGSNLSPEQMAGRCIHSPNTSAVPVAIARMDGWKWFICQRGYANIAPCQPQPQSRGPFQFPIPTGSVQSNSRSPSPPKSAQAQSRSTSPPKVSPSPQPPSRRPSPSPSPAEENHDTVVWGLIYNLTPTDESHLDCYEGYSKLRNPRLTPNPSPDYAAQARKPLLQGTNDYNKLYLPVRVTQWLQPPQQYGLVDHYSTEITVLAYVDEERNGEGTVKPAYVGRMNRAIEQSVKLGFPALWVERVMRRWIVEGPRAPKGYLGGRKGYVDESPAAALAASLSSAGSSNTSPSPSPAPESASAAHGQGQAMARSEGAASTQRAKKKAKESRN